MQAPTINELPTARETIDFEAAVRRIEERVDIIGKTFRDPVLTKIFFGKQANIKMEPSKLDFAPGDTYILTEYRDGKEVQRPLCRVSTMVIEGGNLRQSTTVYQRINDQEILAMSVTDTQPTQETGRRGGGSQQLEATITTEEGTILRRYYLSPGGEIINATGYNGEYISSDTALINEFAL